MNDIESTFRNLTRNLLAERLLEPELTEERCELIFSALMEMLVQVLVPIYTKFLLGFPDSVHVLSRKMSALPSKGVAGLPLSVCPHRGGRGRDIGQAVLEMRMSGRGNQKSRKSYGSLQDLREEMSQNKESGIPPLVAGTCQLPLTSFVGLSEPDLHRTPAIVCVSFASPSVRL